LYDSNENPDDTKQISIIGVVHLENNSNYEKNFISRLYKRQMFGKKVSDVLKFFKPKNTRTILIVLGLIVLAYFLFVYYSPMKMLDNELMTGASEESAPQTTSPEVVESESILTPQQGQPVGDYTGKSVDPSDLLPQDQNSQWASLNPVNQGNVAVPDLLQAGYHIGLDTIGQTLRNANMQLRSDPVISKEEVGPWNRSTIEPDLGRVPLEIGDCSR
jgi:hypothetical protein